MNIKLGAIAALMSAMALALAGCSNSSEPTADTASSATTESGEYTVAIGQYVSHTSLDATVTGFKAALKDAGLDVTYDEQNAQGDQAATTAIAQQFASSKADLVFAVATPIAQAMAQNIIDTPIVFSAVTDPVAAQLVDSLDAPGSNITGTQDMAPVADQIDLIKQVLPEAKSVGIVYSSGEVNAEVQVELARKAAEKQGLEVVEKTITNSSEVSQAADALGDVDAIYVPTDNGVVSALSSLLQVAESKGILVVAAEGDSVDNGAAITRGLDYEKLGYQAGEMAVKILTEGADPATLPIEGQKDPQLMINTQAAEKMGIAIPQELLDQAAKVI